MILNAAIEAWCECLVLRKKASMSLVTESLPSVVRGISDRNRVRRNLVGEIGPGSGLHGYVEFKGDFVAHIREFAHLAKQALSVPAENLNL